jgi:hypothetical protein
MLYVLSGQKTSQMFFEESMLYLSRYAHFNLCLLLLALAVGCGKSSSFSLAPKSEGFYQRVQFDNRVDVLWIIDNSATMKNHQENLGSQVGGFIDILNRKKVDYNLAITTMDMGRGGAKGAFVGTPKILTRSTPNLKQTFFNNVLLGEDGSDLERGLESMASALSIEKLQNENAGFMREGALLVVVFITNEDDHSADSVRNYADFLDELKPPSEFGSPGWIASLIGITDPTGFCKTEGNYVDPGDRYIELVGYSEGTAEDICSNTLSEALDGVRSKIVERLTEFHLSKEPDVNSISVLINRKRISEDPENGWTYHAEGYTIRFHGESIPAADAEIRINYQPLSAE